MQWFRAEEVKPDVEIPVLVAYHGDSGDLEFTVAEYQINDYGMPQWRVYLDAYSVCVTADVFDHEVLFWATFLWPSLDLKYINDYDLSGVHTNMVIEQFNEEHRKPLVEAK
jgi:hypothetical protein